MERKYSVPFIGRKDELEMAKTWLTGDKLVVQICGPALIGKSRFAHQLYMELEDVYRIDNKPFKVIWIGMKEKTDVHVLEQRISVGLVGSCSREMIGNKAKTRRAKGNKGAILLIIFDDCDHMSQNARIRTDFINRINILIQGSCRARVVLTSRVELKFPRLCGAASTLRLRGFTKDEAVAILKSAAPEVVYGSSCAEAIVEQCWRLPLLLIMMSRQLRLRKGSVTSKTICQILHDFPFEPGGLELESVSSFAYGSFTSLSDHLQRLFAIYSYFPGSFSAEAAAYVAKHSKVSEAKVFGLIPLYDRSILDFDQYKRRFYVYPALKLFANRALRHIQETDVVRLRYTQFYGKVLMQASEDLFDHPVEVVFDHLYEEWEHVEHLLREGTHCTGDIYQESMKIVREASDFLLRLTPEAAAQFYRGCLDAADIFGTNEDKVYILTSLGDVIGNSDNSSSDSLKEAMVQYKRAMDLIKSSNESASGRLCASGNVSTSGYLYLKLLSEIEWNYQRQGRMSKARRYQDRALAIFPMDVSRRKVLERHISAKSHKARVLIFEERSEEALPILDELLETARVECPHHPTFRYLLNIFGLAYHRLNDSQKTVQYFRASLAERRKLAKRCPGDIVIPLTNLALRLSMDGKYAQGLRNLEEAKQIRENLSWDHVDTAIVLWETGNLYRNWGKFDETLHYLLEAKRIYMKCVPKHFCISQVQLCIGKTLESMGEIAMAKTEYFDVVHNREMYFEHLMLDHVVVCAFECLMSLCEVGSSESKTTNLLFLKYWNGKLKSGSTRSSTDQSNFMQNMKMKGKLLLQRVLTEEREGDTLVSQSQIVALEEQDSNAR